MHLCILAQGEIMNIQVLQSTGRPWVWDPPAEGQPKIRSGIMVCQLAAATAGVRKDGRNATALLIGCTHIALWNGDNIKQGQKRTVLHGLCCFPRFNKYLFTR